MTIFRGRRFERKQCPRCGSALVTDGAGLKCTQSECAYRRRARKKREKYQPTPTCTCGSTMVLRAIRGTGTFWGCPTYPTCTATKRVRWAWRDAM